MNIYITYVIISDIYINCLCIYIIHKNYLQVHKKLGSIWNCMSISTQVFTQADNTYLSVQYQLTYPIFPILTKEIKGNNMILTEFILHVDST